MTKDELRARLAALHEELDGVNSVDAETRTLLQQLAADIQPILEPSGGDASRTEHTDSLKERLAQSITAVEGAHPKLARTLSDLVDVMVFYNL
jgi:hypothetical protein